MFGAQGASPGQGSVPRAFPSAVVTECLGLQVTIPSPLLLCPEPTEAALSVLGLGGKPPWALLYPLPCACGKGALSPEAQGTPQARTLSKNE